MKELELTLTALEPLVITQGSAEGMAHSCLDHIPGNMLLGAFARAWVQRHPDTDPDTSPDFQDLFLNGAVSWGMAWPLCGAEEALPTPLCLMREKASPGLPVYGTDFNPADFHICNTLPLAKDESLEEAWKMHFAGSRAGQEADNGTPLKFKKLSAPLMSQDSFCQPALHKVWNTRVALGCQHSDKIRNTREVLSCQRSAAKGQLFGFSALAPGLVFRARVLSNRPEAEPLLAALCSIPHIRVGHARSAGYGRLAVSAQWREQGAPERIKSACHDIYLASPYLPDPYWDDPLKSLLKELEALAGFGARREKLNCAYVRIESFNGHWGRPRQSRIALAAGSVLRLRFDGDCELAQKPLGADKLEGYGRILVDPPFLKETFPQIAAPHRQPDGHAPQPAINLADPVWRLMRQRAIRRQARVLADLWLHDPKWQEFIKSAARNREPGASQRARVMDMDKAEFKALLDKAPGQQWKSAVARDPFARGNAHLSEIMPSILEKDAFLRAFTPERLPLVLAGPDPDQGERQEYASLAWQIFRRELIRYWGKTATIEQNSVREAQTDAHS